jgi:hypothetical protein
VDQQDNDTAVAEAGGGGNRLPPPPEVTCGDDPERRRDREEWLRRELIRLQREVMRMGGIRRQDEMRRLVMELQNRLRP